jgi:hypothetical protein
VVKGDTQHSTVHIPWGWVFVTAEKVGRWPLENRTATLGLSTMNGGKRNFIHLSRYLDIAIN